MPSIFALKCNHANSLFLSCTVCIPLSAFSFHVQCPFSYQLFPFMYKYAFSYQLFPFTCSAHSPISFFLSCTVPILLSAFSLPHNTHHSSNPFPSHTAPILPEDFYTIGDWGTISQNTKRCMFFTYTNIPNYSFQILSQTLQL